MRRSTASATPAMVRSSAGTKLSPRSPMPVMRWRWKNAGIPGLISPRSNATIGRGQRARIVAAAGLRRNPSPKHTVEAPRNVPASQMMPAPL